MSSYSFESIDYRIEAGVCQVDRQTICANGLDTVTTDAVDAMYKEMNSTFDIMRDDSDVQVEVVRANLNGTDTKLQVGSYSSAFTTNDGNSYELAVQAAQASDRVLAAIAAPGNGGTSGLTDKEYRYFAKSGRLTYMDDGRLRAVPTIQAYGRILRQAGVNPQTYTSDSFGGRIAIALALEQPRGQVESALYSSLPNLADHAVPAGAPLAIIGRMVGTQQVYYERRDSRASSDPWRVTADHKAQAREALPSIYATEHPEIQRSLPTSAARIKELGRTAAGLSRGSKIGDPLALELEAMLAWQPEARVHIAVGSKDPLLAGTDTAERFRGLLSRLSLTGRAHGTPDMGERVHITEIQDAAHGYKTHYPGIYYALQGQPGV